MQRRNFINAISSAIVLTAFGTNAVFAGDVITTPNKRKKPFNTKKRPMPKKDLADILAGDWIGDVTSDTMGSSKNDVTISIAKVGPNKVKVWSDYSRIPEMIIPLMKSGNKISDQSGKNTIFYDPDKNPPWLDVVYNAEVAWAGQRMGD